jgi:hypothetical protein
LQEIGEINKNRKMLAAVTQLLSTASVARNAALCHSLIQRAAEKGAQVCVYETFYDTFVFVSCSVLTSIRPISSLFDYLLNQLVYLPEAADFIVPTASVVASTVPLSESPFVAAIREQAKASAVWVGVGVHETVNA